MDSTWHTLLDIAQAQQGYFSTSQALECRVSNQLLRHAVKTGRVDHVLRAVYRFNHFPPAPHEELMASWLWADQEGVISHESALELHRLGDVLPDVVHLTLPPRWKRRISRRRVPDNLRIHFASVPKQDLCWMDGVPTTTPARSIIDYAESGGQPDLIERAVLDGLTRGLFALNAIRRALDATSSHNAEG